ncbi:hypothetical protein M422DRAFT_781514 [Sphaerobolus stellatus SS14]|uniref:Uncharacterized protein n=1 Tax=Sphaerobolus stellatus (strain SS14) TaxID=990650 RepID=A0A0C9U524_SPHS4|nr:hypothetical protein M422DRAFT_781514 [Sphaerobolus stellatus SS14]
MGRKAKVYVLSNGQGGDDPSAGLFDRRPIHENADVLSCPTSGRAETPMTSQGFNTPQCEMDSALPGSPNRRTSNSVLIPITSPTHITPDLNSTPIPTRNTSRPTLTTSTKVKIIINKCTHPKTRRTKAPSR